MEWVGLIFVASLLTYTAYSIIHYFQRRQAIQKQLESLIKQRVTDAQSKNLTPIIVVQTGSYSPVHIEHIKMFYQLETNLSKFPETKDYQPVLGLLLPTGNFYLWWKNLSLNIFKQNYIPGKTRLEYCQLALSTSEVKLPWVSALDWEINPPNPIGKIVSLSIVSSKTYIQSVLKEIKSYLPEEYREKCKIVFLCGADTAVKSRLYTGLGSFDVAVIRRGKDTEEFLKLRQNWLRDHPNDEQSKVILIKGEPGDEAAGVMSSTYIRQMIKQGKQQIPGLPDAVAREMFKKLN